MQKWHWWPNVDVEVSGKQNKRVVPGHVNFNTDIEINEDGFNIESFTSLVFDLLDPGSGNW